MFDPTKPVRTRDGCRASMWRGRLEASDYPLVAMIWDPRAETEIVRQYTEGGRINHTGENEGDLVNFEEPPKETAMSWVEWWTDADARHAQQIKDVTPKGGDTEGSHQLADGVLVDILDELGFKKTVAAWKDAEKWYA